MRHKILLLPVAIVAVVGAMACGPVVQEPTVAVTRQAISSGPFRNIALRLTLTGYFSGELKLCFGASATHCPLVASYPSQSVSRGGTSAQGPCTALSPSMLRCVYHDSHRYNAFGIAHPDDFDHITLKRPSGSAQIRLTGVKITLQEDNAERRTVVSLSSINAYVSSHSPFALASQILLEKKRQLCDVAKGIGCSKESDINTYFQSRPLLIQSATLDVNKPSIMLKYSYTRATEFIHRMMLPFAPPETIDHARRNLYGSCGETAGWQMLYTFGISHFASIANRCDNNSSYDRYGACATPEPNASPLAYAVDSIRTELGWKQNNRLAMLQFNANRTDFGARKAFRVDPSYGECKPTPHPWGITRCSIRSQATWRITNTAYTPQPGDLIFRYDRCQVQDGKTGFGHVSVLLSSWMTVSGNNLEVRVFEGGSSLPRLMQRTFSLQAKCGSTCSCPSNEYRYMYYIGLTAP